VSEGSALGAPRRALLVAISLLSLVACAAGGRTAPPPPAAVEAFERGLADLRRAEFEPAGAGRAAARSAFVQALELAPEWIPPARLVDDLDRAALRGSELFGRRLAQAKEPEAAAHYLLARLLGGEGGPQLERALELDPRCAWGEHARSVDAELRGSRGRALELERRAERLAATPYERVVFGQRSAQLLSDAGREREALALLEELLAEWAPQLPPAAALPLELATAAALLADERPDAVERGFELALRLFEGRALRAPELRSLLDSTEAARKGRTSASHDRLVLGALGRGPNAATLRTRGPLAADSTLDLRLSLGAAALSPPSPRESWIEAVRRGEYAAGTRTFVAALPSVARSGDGWPREPRLRRAAELLSAVDGDDRASRLAAAAALLDAGWQDVAAPLIEALAQSLDEAEFGSAEWAQVEQLAARAAAIEAIAAELDLLVAALYDGRRSLALTPLDGADFADAPDSTAGVLAAVGRIFALHGAAAGLEPAVVEAVAQSPRLDFAGLGSVVVPGPRFAARDEAYGVGRAGEPVPGLAAAMDRLGRFALFGAGLGRAPDGTVLRRLWAEERSGEHLGVAWNGVVIWCAGADADGARSRGAARVSGAALHEGYWIDVEAERERLSRFEQLAAEFLGGAGERAAEVLSLPAAEVGGEGGERRRERRRVIPALGQGDRVRLALLVERGAQPRVELDELLEVVQVHEEGHLCDRTRFLPLGRNLGELLALGLGELFGELGLERRLEYRAQLVALACVTEPRLALIDLLDAAEVDSRLVTVHARAYRELLERFLEQLDRSLERDPAAFAALDGGRYLLHQLHRLSGEQVRQVARELAEREGLVRG
jgi:hypothetical protein